jgi:hypothetical protein
MKKKMILVVSCVLLLGLAMAGVTYAQTMPSLAGDLQQEPDDVIADEDLETPAYCLEGKTHPALAWLAEFYEVDYDELLVYFCDYEFGIGEIEHALATAELEDVEMTYQELLEWRYDGGTKEVGWGEIWQALGLIEMDSDEPDMDDPDMDDPEDEDLGENPVCSGEMAHPVLSRMAEEFEVEYAELVVFFCEYKFGIGEIKHALQTAELEDVEQTYDEILNMRKPEGEKVSGWGRIWQELGLIGRDKSDKGEEVELDEMGEQVETRGGKNKPAGSSGNPGKGRGPKK